MELTGGEYLQHSYAKGMSVGSRQRKGLILKEVRALFFRSEEKKNRIDMVGHELEGSTVVVLEREPKYIVLLRSTENYPIFIVSVSTTHEGDEVLWTKGDPYAEEGK